MTDSEIKNNCFTIQHLGIKRINYFEKPPNLDKRLKTIVSEDSFFSSLACLAFCSIKGSRIVFERFKPEFIKSDEFDILLSASSN